MKQQRTKPAPKPTFPAFLCLMDAMTQTAEDAPPPAYALLSVTPEIQASIDAAYDQMARGLPGGIEIPVAVPTVNARVDGHIKTNPFPKSAMLRAWMAALTLTGGAHAGRYSANQMIVEAFNHVAHTPAKPNAVLVVSRYQAPRLRTGMRGGRHRYMSQPIAELEPKNWGYKTMPGLRPLTAVAA